MKDIIIKMIEHAESTHSFDEMDNIKILIDKFSYTVNCPSNWRSVGEELAEIYSDNQDVYESLKLWDYEY